MNELTFKPSAAHKLDDPEVVETVVGVGYRLGLDRDP